jgi:hypothetical protein
MVVNDIEVLDCNGYNGKNWNLQMAFNINKWFWIWLQFLKNIYIKYYQTKYYKDENLSLRTT